MTRTAIPETRRLVLRVNDNPTADEEILEWLQARGAALLNARSTASALELMGRARVDVVISDLAREENGILNKQAGIQLARKIREAGSQVPIAIYTNHKTPQVKKLAVDAGANYVTEAPDELLRWLENMGI